nr:hypothetical protein GCM10025730_46880 [Promicromonospora thailandica]
MRQRVHDHLLAGRHREDGGVGGAGQAAPVRGLGGRGQVDAGADVRAGLEDRLLVHGATVAGAGVPPRTGQAGRASSARTAARAAPNASGWARVECAMIAPS